MVLREIAITAPRPLRPEDGATEDMSRVICGLLIQGLKRRLQFDGFSKISIRINHADTREQGKVLLGVLIVNHQLSCHEIVNWDRLRRQTYLLDFVGDVIRNVCSARDMDPRVVDEACSYVAEQGFRRLIKGRSVFPGPFPAATAGIECEQELDEARIYVAAALPDGARRRILVATVRPDEFIIQNYFGQLEWLGSRRLQLRTHDEVTLAVDLDPRH